MVRQILFFVFVALLAVALHPALADNVSSKPVVVLDPGHSNKSPGAKSATARYEVWYNDQLVSLLANALSRAGLSTVLTRKPGQEIQLPERAAIENSYNPLAMLSIHHDSAQLVHLEQVEWNGKKTYRTCQPISGYSIFISRKNPRFDGSYVLAKLLGEELQKLGRKPSLHHAEPIPGEGRPLLDTNLGIYQYDDLVVLKMSSAPAILLEVGVIVDLADEAYISDTQNQEAIVNAVVQSLRRFNSLAR